MVATGDLLDEIKVGIERRTRRSSTVSAGDLVLARHETSAPDYRLTEPLFVLMAQGGKRLYLGDTIIEYAAGDCLLVTASMPLSGHFLDATPEHPALAFALRLAAPKITALLSRLPSGRPGGRARGEAITTRAADTGVLDAVARLLRLFDEPLDAEMLGPLVETEILWRLLRGSSGPVVAQLGRDGSALNRVSKAIEIIRGSFTEPIAARRLASAAGMSVSSFRRHFRRVTGMSPLQFQKTIQLQEARSLLLSGHTATETSQLVGYASPTQFSREYRHHFGLPPRTDASRLTASEPFDALPAGARPTEVGDR